MSLIATSVIRAAGEGPHIPGPLDFELDPLFAGATKPMILVVLSAVLILGLFYAMSRRAAVVPGRLQFAGEYVYDFVRNSIARDTIGAHDFQRFVPILFAIFTFVLVNNFYGVIPFLQFPSMSRIGFPIAIALVIWLIYNGVGIVKHGFLGYLKHQTVPGGISGPILIALVPLEFFSNIIVRPFTLALRLFATMFAGHLLLILFSTGAEYLISSYDPKALGITAGVLSFVIGIAVSFLDMLVMFLQAYVITLLAAMYIGSAIAEEH